MYTVTKTYRDLPAAHRQPFHEGHCKLAHGHNWRFDITFTCEELDSNGFVVDVGHLERIKLILEDRFDHTLLINHNDPKLSLFQAGADAGLWKLVVVDNCGMEGLAKMVYDLALDVIKEQFGKGVTVLNVVCWEDSKNRATYTPTP